jgi:hypothetical protein
MVGKVARKGYDTAVHSDFLIHWTGDDIDHKHHPNWDGNAQYRSLTDDHVTQLYLDRLRNIVAYGLWMTEEGESIFKIGGEEIHCPSIPKCCFTELKLSESRRHARLYGRLGIGVKRKFLFSRHGRPVAYYGFRQESHEDKFLEACSKELQDRVLLNFFKPMNSTGDLNYDLYSESEWRLLFFPELLKNKLSLIPEIRPTQENTLISTPSNRSKRRSSNI